MLRRPLTIAAFSYAAGIAVRHTARDGVSTVILAVSACVIVCLLFFLLIECQKDTDKTKISINDISDIQTVTNTQNKIRRAALIFAMFSLIGITSESISEGYTSQFNDAFEEQVTIQGVVKSVEIRDKEKCRLVLFAETKNGERIRKERVLVTVKEYSGNIIAITGKSISVSGTMSEPEAASNPGAFDYADYLRSKKIHSTMYTEYGRVRIHDEKLSGWNFINNRIACARYYFEQKLIEQFDDKAAGMLCGILFGDDTFMDEETAESFRQNGIGHLLAASGLHVGFVYALLNVILGKPVGFKRNLPLMVMLAGYAALAGFSPSVVRAVFMIYVYMLGKITHRRYDFLTCIAFCALVLLIYEPAWLFASGFQLSFMAVLSLSIVLRKLEKYEAAWIKHLRIRLGRESDKWTDRANASEQEDRRIIKTPLPAMIALQLGMVPLTLIHFHYISLAGLILNAPAIALAGIIVPLGMMLMPLTILGGPIYEFVGMMAEMLVRLLIWMNNLFSGTVFSFKYMASPPLALTILYYMVLFFCCSEEGSRLLAALPGYRIRLLLLAAACTASLAVGTAASYKYLLSDLTFVDVGQGDCAHLAADGNVDLMFDSGGSDTRDIGMDVLMPYFLGNGVSDIDLAVISHLHQDHYGGLKTLTAAVPVRRLLLSEVYRSQAPAISAETGIPVSDMIFAHAGDVINAGGARITVLAPPAKSAAEYAAIAADLEDENQACLVVRMDYKGRSVIFTGDIDSDYEKELCRVSGSLLETDILKIAHHGSKYSTCEEFLTATEPTLSVIQVGTNFYGHPSPDTLERIEEHGIDIARNDLHGAVMVQFSRTLKVRSMQDAS